MLQFKNLFRRKSVKKNAKNQVQEITIIQEDDTDYEKQWSRKVGGHIQYGTRIRTMRSGGPER